MEKSFLSPPETIRAIVDNGRRVITQPRLCTLLLSLLAGFYIAFGAQLATLVTHDAAPHIGVGISRFLGGSVFSLGLMLVVICGAELFTGNSMLAISALHGAISWRILLENWIIVLGGNLAGSLFFAWLMFASGLWQNSTVADHAVTIATLKCQLPFGVALIRGILCNWLVCLAVFMATAARDVTGKLLACYMPIMAFVASGFEHSIANMYFIPMGLMISAEQHRTIPDLSWPGFFMDNLLPVTLGNILGGVVFVAASYWYIHLRDNKK
jgi:formate/nitrite transporter